MNSESLETKINLYWYGKIGFAKNRKLGHINVVGTTSTKALKIAKKVRGDLSI